MITGVAVRVVFMYIYFTSDRWAIYCDQRVVSVCLSVRSPFSKNVGVYVYACLIFHTKTAEARITTRDIETFHRKSWKPIHFGIKVTRHKNKSVSIFRQNKISTIAAYVSYAGFSPQPMLLPMAGFSVLGVLIIADVSHAALVKAGFF